MICDATLHFTRIPKPRLAIKLMRVERPCGCEEKTVALCAYCYEVDLERMTENPVVKCSKCGYRFFLRDSWSMIGDA